MTTPRARILAIDDTPANLHTLGAVLEGEFELQFAISGLAGIALALKTPPDLILLDVMMPDVDGFETFRRLALQPTLQHIPVIFVTALNDVDSEETGLSLGAADYITKPINVVIARQRIRNLLTREQLRKEVQRQADSLRKLWTVVEQGPASVVITNLDACLEYVNPRFTAVTGYSAAEVLGKNPRMLQSGLTPKATHLELWDTISHGLPWKGELVNKRKNGELYWEEAQIAPVKDAAGMVTHYVAVKTDISARKQLEMQREEALARLQKIASRVPGVVYQYLLRADGTSCFPFASDAIRDIYRVEPEDVREDASRVLAVLHPDDAPEVAASIERSARALTPWLHEYRVKFDDGTVRWLLGNAVPQAEPDGAVLWHGYISDVTERKNADAVFHGLFEQSSFLAGILDEQGRLLAVNSTALRYTDATREQLIGQYFPDTPWWRNPQDRANLIGVLDQAFAGQASSCEVSHPLSGGGSIDVLFSATPIRLENQTRLAVIGVDITERKSAEQKLRLAASVFIHSHEGITIADAQGLIVDVNESFSRITGYSRSEALGKNPSILKSGRHDQAFYASMWHDLQNKSYWSGEVWNQRKSGEVYPEMLTISAVRDAHGSIQQYVALFADISKRKAMEEQVLQLAFYDELTGLPNRRLLGDRLRQTLAASKRSGLYGAVMFLDLDNFKQLNDVHGHGVGDLLLVEVARRLAACVREVDTVARFGGDEFVVLLGELDVGRVESIAQAHGVAEKIRVSLEVPYKLAGNKSDDMPVVEHHCSASIGVVLFSSEQANQDEILKWADAAMYQAKNAGRNKIRFL
jgi:diguanylate cyclase (GGDEF)-like protein/PAS domain S-box-containing protein